VLLHKYVRKVEQAIHSVFAGLNTLRRRSRSPRSGATCRTLELQAVLACRASQYAGIASAATAVVIGYIAGGTRTIRVGSGGVMLPNHAPRVIAEQFGTLESLYRGRIDLGLGRAPGTDQRTARALRRDLATTAENFPHDVMELQALLGPLQPGQMVRAVPGAGLRVPIWLLGSSTFSAQLAAMLGLPFAFASHFAPSELMRALDVYRARF
jgi:luciferase family oxidoreductase group 1